MTVVLSPQDLSFLLYDWLNVCELTKHDRFSAHSRETFDAVLQLSQDIATKVFAPLYQTLDRAEPHRRHDGTVEMIPEAKDALDQFIAAGLMGGGFDENLGGQQLPNVMTHACMAWIQAANIGLAGYATLSVGAANLLVAYGSTDQIDTWVRPMRRGPLLRHHVPVRAAGRLVAGRHHAPRAEPADDGTYRVTGDEDVDLRRRPRTHREHRAPRAGQNPRRAAGGQGHLAVHRAEVPGPDGTARNDVALAGLNHKMGYRGTVNTVLNFGDGTFTPAGEPGAVGYLVGEQHHGLTYMFHMMNEARMVVGLRRDRARLHRLPEVARLRHASAPRAA